MRFTIGFDLDDRARVHRYWDEIFDTQQWTESKFTALFACLLELERRGPSGPRVLQSPG